MAVTVSTLSRTSALEPGNAFAHDMVCLGEAGKWIGTLKFLGGPEQPMAVPADMASLLIEGRLSADQQASAVIAAEHLIETAKAESVSLAP
jgi:hypothetical protein